MSEYELVCEFDITRRINWSDEELGVHIDAVMDSLHQAEGVDGVTAEANLDSGRTTMWIRFSTVEEDVQHYARAVLGVAVRANGGEHVGLLPLGEEGVFRAGRNQWSGLRTPSWKVRNVGIAGN